MPAMRAAGAGAFVSNGPSDAATARARVGEQCSSAWWASRGQSTRRKAVPELAQRWILRQMRRKTRRGVHLRPQTRQAAASCEHGGSGFARRQRALCFLSIIPFVVNNVCHYLTRGPPPASAPPPRGASRRRTSRSQGLHSRSRPRRGSAPPTTRASSPAAGGRRRTRRIRRRRTRDNLGYTRSPTPTSASTCPRAGACVDLSLLSASSCRSAAAPARATRSRGEPS